MFLVYNFHLQEEKKEELRASYLLKLEERLQRKLNENDFYNIDIYGLEAFYLASFKLLDENHLFEAWKKMNKLWTAVKKTKVEKIESDEEEKYLILLGISLENQDLFKIATSIDHLLKIYEKRDHVSLQFIDLLKQELPFLIDFC